MVWKVSTVWKSFHSLKSFLVWRILWSELWRVIMAWRSFHGLNSFHGINCFYGLNSFHGLKSFMVWRVSTVRKVYMVWRVFMVWRVPRSEKFTWSDELCNLMRAKGFSWSLNKYLSSKKCLDLDSTKRHGSGYVSGSTLTLQISFADPIRIRRIRMFLGLLNSDPDPLVWVTDPDPATDPSIIKQK